MSDLLNIGIEGQPRLKAITGAMGDDEVVVTILDKVGAALLARNRDRFLKAVNPNNQAWKVSLAAIERAQKGRGGLTLYDTGRLFHSIQLYADSDRSRAIGTDVPYGKFHQYGKLGRQFLGIGDEDVPIAQNIAINEFVEALK